MCYSISPPNTTRFSSLALQHGLQQVSAGYLPLHQCRIRQSPLPQAATSATNVANAMGLSELSHQRFRVITTTTSFACFTPQLLNTEMLCLAHVDEEHAFERIDSTLFLYVFYQVLDSDVIRLSLTCVKTGRTLFYEHRMHAVVPCRRIWLCRGSNLHLTRHFLNVHAQPQSLLRLPWGTQLAFLLRSSGACSECSRRSILEGCFARAYLSL